MFVMFQLKAYDPDIQDRNAPQHIVYNVVDKQQQNTYLTISDTGCLSLLKVISLELLYLRLKYARFW